MKLFKFKLEGLLKIRKMKEEQVKVELGLILKNINDLKSKIKQNNLDIKIAHESVEKSLETTTKAELIQFFPQYINAKMADSENLENEIYGLKKKHESKLKELIDAISKKDIISKLKDKKMVEHRIALNRKENIELDDMYIIRQGSVGVSDG